MGVVCIRLAVCCLEGGDSSCLLTSSLTPPTREQLPSVSKAARNPQEPTLPSRIPERFVNLSLTSVTYIDQREGVNLTRLLLSPWTRSIKLRRTTRPFLIPSLCLSSAFLSSRRSPSRSSSITLVETDFPDLSISLARRRNSTMFHLLLIVTIDRRLEYLPEL